MNEPRIVNLDQLTESTHRSFGEKYESRHFPIGTALGGRSRPSTTVAAAAGERSERPHRIPLRPEVTAEAP